MTKITTAAQLAAKVKDVAQNYKTLYVYGCFGSPLTAANKKRMIDHAAYNKRADRTAMINAASADTFGFDCVNLIKGLLWGWCGDKTKTHGGAVYKTNGVPDTNADGMFNACTGVSTDFTKIEVGEAVWMKDHIGIYIGDGLAVECTPAWKNCVQITACNCSKTGYKRRNWTKHGKLPYVKYEAAEPEKTTSSVAADSFFPARGYFKRGDVSPNVGKIASFMRKTFPAYTSAKALGNTYGPNLIKAITEFQRRTGLEPDGCTGPLTLAKLEQYGFKR